MTATLAVVARLVLGQAVAQHGATARSVEQRDVAMQRRRRGHAFALRLVGAGSDPVCGRTGPNAASAHASRMSDVARENDSQAVIVALVVTRQRDREVWRTRVENQANGDVPPHPDHADAFGSDDPRGSARARREAARGARGAPGRMRTSHGRGRGAGVYRSPTSASSSKRMSDSHATAAGLVQQRDGRVFVYGDA